MPVYANRARMATTTTGTGTIDLDGGAVSGYQTFAAAGVSNGDVVRYVIEDGTAWEIGTGTFTDAATDTLSRTLTESSTGSLLNLSGSAEVYITAAKSDFVVRPEQVYAISGTTPTLDPENGTIQTWTLTANSTPADGLSDGESMTVMVADGASTYTVDWTTTASVVFVGGTEPAIPTTGYAVIALWKVGSTLYGKGVGDVA